MNYFFELEFGLRSKNKWPLVASVFEFEPFNSYFPNPLPRFKLVSFRWMPLCLKKGMSQKSMPPTPKFVTLTQQKKTHSLLLLSFWFFGYTHQLSNARGCHFIKIWFNGSIRTSFTESYKIKHRLPHRPIRAPIFFYYSWAASYMKQPNYVGLKKMVLILPLNQILMKGQPLTSDI